MLVCNHYVLTMGVASSLKRVCALKQIQWIVYGAHTMVFDKARRRLATKKRILTEEWRCFSVKTDKRTFDIQVSP